MDESTPPLLYSRLASWWPLLSDPADYAEEAALYRGLFEAAGAAPGSTVLELGCGGGNNASHLKAAFRMTLTDVSAEMLETSARLNPECEHVRGDMRTLDLGRTFDAVFVHDAIDYMTTEEDLAAAVATVSAHCRPGGAFVIAADHVEETFEPSTDHGGHDDGERSLRYLEWTHDRNGTTYLVDYAYLLCDGERVTVEHDRHVNGVFPRATWLRLLENEGLDARTVTLEFSDGSSNEVFTGTKL